MEREEEKGGNRERRRKGVSCPIVTEKSHPKGTWTLAKLLEIRNVSKSTFRSRGVILLVTWSDDPCERVCLDGVSAARKVEVKDGTNSERPSFRKVGVQTSPLHRDNAGLCSL